MLDEWDVGFLAMDLLWVLSILLSVMHGASVASDRLWLYLGVNYI